MARHRDGEILNRSTTGEVKWWDDKKGFGFIIETGPQRKEIFFHHSQILSKERGLLTEGRKVGFAIVQGQKGPMAKNVRVKDSR